MHVPDAKVTAMPDIGAGTEESEEICAVMAARQLMDYLAKENITESVNSPIAGVERAFAPEILHLGAFVQAWHFEKVPNSQRFLPMGTLIPPVPINCASGAALTAHERR